MLPSDDGEDSTFIKNVDEDKTVFPSSREMSALTVPADARTCSVKAAVIVPSAFITDLPTQFSWQLFYDV